MDNQRTGFTKTGFSKAGFAACSHFQECQMGKLSCYYQDIDPEVEKHCFCFRRHHSNSKSNGENQPNLFDDSAEQKKERVTSNDEIEQLSLF